MTFARMSTPTTTTLQDLRACFDKWDIPEHGMDWFPVDRDGKPNRNGPGVTLRYLRGHAWQTVSCGTFPRVQDNLRQVYLLLDRLRIAETHGVTYSGLSSEKGLVPLDAQEQRGQTLLDAYRVLGAEPSDTMDMIEGIYRLKARNYHPDVTHGDPVLAERFKQLQWAIEEIRKSRVAKV